MKTIEVGRYEMKLQKCCNISDYMCYSFVVEQQYDGLDYYSHLFVWIALLLLLKSRTKELRRMLEKDILVE